MSLAAIAWLILVAAMQSASTAETTINQALQAELLEIGRSDQKIREEVPLVIAAHGLQSTQFAELAQRMNDLNAAHFARLESIIERSGWPGLDLVGRDASNAAFLVLQHGTLEKQKQYLETFRKAVAAGQARALDLSLLEDRILIRDGRKQLYGSSVTMGPDGVPRLDPIEDPAKLPERRAALGLPTIEVYLDRLERDMGRPIDRQALSAEP